MLLQQLLGPCHGPYWGSLKCSPKPPSYLEPFCGGRGKGKRIRKKEKGRRKGEQNK